MTSPPYQSDFSVSQFRNRWERVFDYIGSDSIVVLQGCSHPTGYMMPRQYNEFYYFCGVETPHSYLLLDGRSRKSVLYLPDRNPRLEAAEGRILCADDVGFAQAHIGVDEVSSTKSMGDGWLAGLPDGVPSRIFTPFSPCERNAEGRYELNFADSHVAADYWDARIARGAHFRELLRARYPRCAIENLTPVIDEMRVVKDEAEIGLIRRASRIAALGIMEAMRCTRSGLYEYHLDAAARYVFLVNGCRTEAYRSITAAGTENINNMHYYRNEGVLKNGDLVLMDYAPELHYYASDVTRMWPVSGKFDDWQRELLQFVLDYRNAIMPRIRPGASVAEIRNEAKAAMEPVFAKTKFSKPSYEQGARKLVETGGGVFSHPVGLAVHDVGKYGDCLKPGHIFTIDPQLFVPEESLYIRLEDTVVVTENGVENFTEFMPTELDDIEQYVKGDGIVQRFPEAQS